MKRYPGLSIQQIHELFDVDMESGRLFWKKAGKGRRMKAGEEAGFPKEYKNSKIYWTVKVNRIGYRRSQIIFAVKTGGWPDEIVDHENGNSLDDKPSNLRHASSLQNGWNKKGCRKKTDAPMGVRKLIYGRFEARITYRSKLQSIGVYDSAEEAHSAYLAKRRELFGEFC